MSRNAFSLLLAGLFLGSVHAEESVMLANPDEKLALKIQATTGTKGGIVTRSGAKDTLRQSVDITRTRVVERTMKPDSTGGEVTCRFLQDRITTAVDGKSETSAGPLDHKVAAGLRDAAGKWIFTLADRPATGDVVQQLDELAGFENRKWLPGRRVAVGETWNFTPWFISSSLQRDIPNPQVVGIMKLRELGKAADGSRQATIDCVINGGGETEAPDGSIAKAEGGLKGLLIVNLDQPARMRMDLVGRLKTESEQKAGSTSASLPLNLSVTIEPLGK
ncbi:hypothetical protein [Haloferula sp. BvORR071]|uniref:hypothetical protein n=1 Tax=Haloferula sp. BvORR071 TaxID=1396141 RepID=UPI0005597A84|nr:hypothetical protein [Haloferula sp. BvORR071]